MVSEVLQDVVHVQVEVQDVVWLEVVDVCEVCDVLLQVLVELEVWVVVDVVVVATYSKTSTV